MIRRLGLFAIAVSLLMGCPEPEEPTPTEPLFPTDYATAGFTQVRDCRRSVDHDLTYVRVFADPIAHPTYESRTGTFADGSTIVKEEYADSACTDLIGWAVMRREAGFAPRAGDWHWQEVTIDREVTSDGSLARCFLCHESCQAGANHGYDWACADP